MRCLKPFLTLTGAFGCGQCLPCRVQKRRQWSHRIMLEAADHGKQNSFVTLTYAQEKRTLEPIDLQRWLKRFRKAVSPTKIRFFAVGEYGDQSWRPHYHAALFGWPACFGGTRPGIGEPCPCHACSVVRETWNFGHVMVGQLTEKSAAYIAGYVTKKMTMHSDTRLHGRHPEFARMSLRPGIGADAMHNVASAMMQYRLEESGEVPSALRYGKNHYRPLGKYLRGKLRPLVGLPDGPSEEALQNLANRLQLVRRFAFDNSRSVASVFQEINEPYARQVEARLSLKGRKL